MTALKEDQQASVKALIEEARAAGAERGTVREQVQALHNEFRKLSVPFSRKSRRPC
tara:strand:- start:83 stop:250 length:168 start_codon:yes stop_codon:yes gene_type:complete